MKKTKNESWPFPERRNPKLSDPDFLGSYALSNGLKYAIDRELKNRKNLKVIDVGCGSKPFYPFFKNISKEYIGTDIVNNNSVDIICPAESIDIEDNYADVVLCLSVLEHVDDPSKVVKELYRITKKNGVVFASTHGAFVFHPYPQDHWRWTQTGLKVLFEKNGYFKNIYIFTTLGSIATLFIPASYYLYEWASKNKIRRKLFRKLMVFICNYTGLKLDKKIKSLHDINKPTTLFSEIFIVAKK